MNVQNTWGLLKETGSEWMEDKAPRLGAALAYYTAFSLAPLLVIVIGIAGLVLHQQNAGDHVINQIESMVGEQGGEAVRTMVESEYAKIDEQQGSELAAELRDAVARYELPSPRRPGGGDVDARRDDAYLHWLRTNTEPQRQAGYRRVTAALPIGDITSEQLRSLTELASRFGNDLDFDAGAREFFSENL